MTHTALSKYARLGPFVLAGILTIVFAATAIARLVESSHATKLMDASTGKAEPPAAAAAAKPPTMPGGPGMPGAGLDQQVVAAIVKRNIFSPPIPGVRLTAVMGSKAYFSNGLSGAAGDNLGTLQVVEVGPGWAKVKMDGREQQMYVFAPTAQGGAPGMPPGFPAGIRLPPGVQLPPGIQLPAGVQIQALPTGGAPRVKTQPKK